ncbi:MAG: hypothetical protein V8K32_12590 [Candidatus Electrothrix gigas]
MHNKNIKRIVQKELKKNYPNWNRLNRKTKKEISRKVLAQVAGEYDFKQEISASPDELLGVEQQVPTKGIISLDQMADIKGVEEIISILHKNSYLIYKKPV